MVEGREVRIVKLHLLIGWFRKRQGPHIAKLENHQKSKMDKEASNVININCNKKVR